MSTIIGSGKKVMDSTAHDLSNAKWAGTGINMFNVTLLTAKGSKIKDKVSDTFAVIEWDYDPEKIFSTEKSFVGELRKHENRIMDELVRGGDEEFVKELKARKFDLCFSILVPYEQMACKSLGVPLVVWESYLFDPMISVFNQLPWVAMSSTLPTLHPNGDFLRQTGHLFPPNRLILHIFPNVLNTVIWHVCYPRRRFLNDSPRIL